MISKTETNLSCKELRVLLLHEYRLGHKATEVARNICSTMGEDILSIRTAQHWFNRSKLVTSTLIDSRHSGRPVEVDVDVLKQLIEEDPRLTTRCLAERLGCSHTTVENTFERIRQGMEIWGLGNHMTYRHISSNSELMLVWI